MQKFVHWILHSKAIRKLSNPEGNYSAFLINKIEKEFPPDFDICLLLIFVHYCCKEILKYHSAFYSIILTNNTIFPSLFAWIFYKLVRVYTLHLLTVSKKILEYFQNKTYSNDSSYLQNIYSVLGTAIGQNMCWLIYKFKNHIMNQYLSPFN